jgi:hypothetical protein
MELYERVDAVIGRLAKSRSHLAKQLNIKQTTFNSWFSGDRQEYLLPALYKVLALYPNISREWLFFGEGEMIKTEGQGPPVSQSREKELLLKIEQLSGLLVRLENQVALQGNP